jgi:hypothetical protein
LVLRFETLNALENRPGRLARQQARRQHRERITGMLVVCLGIAVLAVAVFALREPNGRVAASVSHEHSTSNAANQSSTAPAEHAKSSKSRRTDAKSGTAVKDVPLVVLNNTTVAGLAAGAAHRFEAGGWTVTSSGNYQNDILSTCAYYDPSSAGAQAAARALQRQFPTIKRVEPKFPELPAGPVVVVLTPDYSPA